VDYAAVVEGGTLQAGSDAADARWVPLHEVDQWETTPGVVDMIERARKVRDEAGEK